MFSGHADDIEKAGLWQYGMGIVQGVYFRGAPCVDGVVL
jgi:hypothetical protein